MSNQMDKWHEDEKALAVERRLMNEALAQLGQAELKYSARRSAARLIFGLDLTGSREPSLRQARIATAAMFDTIKAFSAVAVKLIYYRGTDECRESRWYDDPEILSQSMRKLSCERGGTQIGRLLQRAVDEKEATSGVVFVGDHCEDDPDELFELAQALRRRSTPLFVFHECADHDEWSLKAKPVFKRLAELSGGVYVEFKPDSGVVLKELLSGVAIFSAAGAEGIERMALPTTPEARQLRGHLCLGSGSKR